MSNSTINGRYRTHYPFDKDDVRSAGTDAEKTALANEWNAVHEAKWNYEKHRVDGETTSSLNPTTGRRENIVHTSGYEKIGEQLDKLWHDIDNGTLDKTGSFYTAIKTVKDRWSKS